MSLLKGIQTSQPQQAAETEEEENLPALGQLIFDPEGGEGGIPTLTVRGEEAPGIREQFFPGATAISQTKDEGGEKPVLRDRFGKPVPELASEVDPETGETILTASPARPDRPGGVQEKLEKGLAVGALGGLEALGVPTRALGALVNPFNPFADLDDVGKTFSEVMADPDSGIFKSARKAVREKDLPGAIKFAAEFLISIPEDPLTWLGGLVSGAARTGTGIARRSAQKKAITGVKEELAQPPGQTQLLQTVEGVDIPVSPAQKEFIARGEVSVETAKRELKARANSPETLAQIDKARADDITAGFQALRAKHGFDDTGGGDSLFEGTRQSVQDAINRYRDEVNQLYKPINDQADKSIVQTKTRKIVDNVFKEHEIISPTAPRPKPSIEEFNRAIREAKEKGIRVGFDDNGFPINADTGEQLIPAPIVKTAGDLGITDDAWKLLQRSRREFEREGIDFKSLRNRAGLIGEFAARASRKGKKRDAMILGQVHEDLNQAIASHLFDLTGNKELVDDWMIADAFVRQNASGVKAAKNLMFTVDGTKRTGAQVMKEFAKVPTRKKGNVLSSMMDFFNPEDLQNLRNFFFNDLINKATQSKGGLSGKSMQRVLNAQPEDVFNKVFTGEMRDDISEILTKAVADDLAKQLTKAELGRFTVRDKQSMINTIFGNPAYRMWAATNGFTKANLRAVSALTAADLLVRAAGKQSSKKASQFLKTGDTAGPFRLTFRGFKEGFTGTGRRLGQKTALTQTIQRDLNPLVKPPNQTVDENNRVNFEQGTLLEGVQ